MNYIHFKWEDCIWLTNYISVQLLRNKVGGTFLEDLQHTRCHDSRAKTPQPQTCSGRKQGRACGAGQGRDQTLPCHPTLPQLQRSVISKKQKPPKKQTKTTPASLLVLAREGSDKGTREMEKSPPSSPAGDKPLSASHIYRLSSTLWERAEFHLST